MLLREVASEGVLHFRSGSQERTQGWDHVTAILNSLSPDNVIPFNCRGVKGKCFILLKNHRAKQNKELAQTGVAGNPPTEMELLLDDLDALEQSTRLRAEEEAKQKANGAEQEKGNALEIRTSALKRIGETKKRASSKSADSPGEGPST